MPLITRTVAKGIPPRVRPPARKGKRKVVTVKTKEKRKRDSDDENSDDINTSNSDSSNLRNPKKKKKRRSKHSDEEESEVEMVEDEPEVEMVEDEPAVPKEVVDVDVGPPALGDEDVSKFTKQHLYIICTHNNLGRAQPTSTWQRTRR
jgi:hypothetical protein